MYYIYTGRVKSRHCNLCNRMPLLLLLAVLLLPSAMIYHQIIHLGNQLHVEDFLPRINLRSHELFATNIQQLVVITCSFITCRLQQHRKLTRVDVSLSMGWDLSNQMHDRMKLELNERCNGWNFERGGRKLEEKTTYVHIASTCTHIHDTAHSGFVYLF